jgi:hypothetical protein
MALLGDKQRLRALLGTFPGVNPDDPRFDRAPRRGNTAGARDPKLRPTQRQHYERCTAAINICDRSVRQGIDERGFFRTEYRLTFAAQSPRDQR